VSLKAFQSQAGLEEIFSNQRGLDFVLTFVRHPIEFGRKTLIHCTYFFIYCCLKKVNV